MGLKNWVHNKRLSDPVAGTYQLTSCSVSSGGASHENCRMHGVVTAPGLAPTAVEHYCTAPVARWPQPGATLPVTVDRADPTRLRIEWDQVATNRDRGQRLAEDLAASMGSGPAGAAVPTPPGAGYPTPSAGADVPAPFGSLLNTFVEQARAGGTQVTTDVTYSVLGAPGRAMPGAAGGGLTPAEAGAAAANSSMQSATARVLAVHDVAVPPGMPGGGPAGTVDLTLDVTLPSGEGWATSMRIAFSTPEKRARVATVGLTLPVLVNPRAHDQIAIDTTRLV